MHCGVMALLQLHSLADVVVNEVPALFRNIKLARQVWQMVCGWIAWFEPVGQVRLNTTMEV